MIKNVTAIHTSLVYLKKVQTLWLYFEPILNILEISKIIPDEYEKFKIINETFKGILRHFLKRKEVISSLIHAKIFEKSDKNYIADLEKIYKDLEIIAASVDKFLVVKRNLFPRF